MFSVDKKFDKVQKGLILAEAMTEPLEAPDWKAELKSVEATPEEKVNAMASMIKSLDSFIDELKNEENRLKDRRYEFEFRRDQARKAVASIMEDNGMEVAMSGLFTTALKEGKESVEITDVEKLKDIAEIWRPYKFEASNVDKKVAKEMLLDGKITEGVTIVKGEKYIQIK